MWQFLKRCYSLVMTKKLTVQQLVLDGEDKMVIGAHSVKMIGESSC